MKKFVAFVLMFVCIFGMAGCQLNQPDFENFQEYENDFVLIKNFLVDFDFDRTDASPSIVDLSSQYLTIAGDEISDRTIVASVKTIYDKGFAYIEVTQDYMIFWEDETGYYGVLWSDNPTEAIGRICGNSRPNMKSRKLTEEWYEVGALDSI